MAKESEIKKILRDHEKRISSLEALTGKPKKAVAKSGKLSLSDHILKLRDAGFFSQPRIVEEVNSRLKGKYHCETDRVAMALLRLAKRKELRRATKVADKKKYKAYVW